MSTLRITLISLTIALCAAPAFAGHGNKAARNDRAIILQNNSMERSYGNGGIILQNQNRVSGRKNRGGIILQNNDVQSANYNGGIILQNNNRVRGAKNRGGIILQDQNRGGIIQQRKNRNRSYYGGG